MVMVLVYNLWGTVQMAQQPHPGITTQFYEPAQVDHSYDAELINFLLENGETRGYTNYWVSYPLAFLTGEELVYVPRLPYHPDFRYTTRDDRYEPYGQIVSQSDQVAFITTNNPALDEYIREKFAEIGITWQEEEIGDFRVFYNLSAVVRPEQIGLGEEY